MKIKKKKKKLFKRILFLLIYEVFFITITLPVITLYGPFKNIKQIYVETAMSTFKHQWLAKKFFSEKQINNLSSNNNSQTADVEDADMINIAYKNDDEIQQYNISDKKFCGYLLEIKDPTRLKIAYSNKLGTAGQTTSQIAEQNNAVAAINGGGFTDKSNDGKLYVGTGAFPDGFVISDGKIIYPETPSDTPAQCIAFDNKGKMLIGNYAPKELVSNGITQAVAFSLPNSILIVNGKSQIYDSLAGGLAPRTAIAQRKDGSLLLLVIDGRNVSKLQPGATLKDVQDILLQNGAWNAFNLDGGSSSTMYYNGQVINNPCDPLGERSVATSIIIK